MTMEEAGEICNGNGEVIRIRIRIRIRITEERSMKITFKYFWNIRLK